MKEGILILTCRTYNVKQHEKRKLLREKLAQLKICGVYFFSDVNKEQIKKIREVKVTVDREEVKVQVLEGSGIPVQDVSTEELDQSPSPSLGTFQATNLEQYLCPVHHEEVKKHAARNGWLYYRCPATNCFVMTGVREAKEYFHAVCSTLMDYYKENWNKLFCFCREPVVLSKSCSKDNPGRIYFKCKRKGKKKCNFFQWGDE